MKFSVLISVYKNDIPEYFNQAVNSILNQTLIPNEVVLVRDGSVGLELNREIQSFINNKIVKVKYIELNNNVGLGLALSIGMKNVSYDYVARMDSDDISNPSRFEIQMKRLNECPDISVLGSYIREFDTKNNKSYIKKVPLNPIAIKSFSKYRNPINHVSVFFRKSALEKAGGYESVFSYEDYYLWLKMISLDIQIENIPISLVDVRAGEDLIQRRRGWSIFRNDLYFFKKVYREKYIVFHVFLVNVLIRFFIRMIPFKLTDYSYKLIRKFSK
jgi:glycosyltransferase involved in cell wall biosynthesis